MTFVRINFSEGGLAPESGWPVRLPLVSRKLRYRSQVASLIARRTCGPPWVERVSPAMTELPFGGKLAAEPVPEGSVSGTGPTQKLAETHERAVRLDFCTRGPREDRADVTKHGCPGRCSRCDASELSRALTD